MSKIPPPRNNSALVQQLKSMSAKSKGKPSIKKELKSKQFQATRNNIKVGALIKHPLYSRLWKIEKIMKVNVQCIPHPSLPSDRIQTIKISELKNYILV